MKVVGISGSISSPSRTRVLVEDILGKLSQRTHGKYELIDIADIAKELGATLSYDQLPPVIADAYKKLSSADIIVIGTPVYKASYTGLMKHFFDLIDPKLLAGKVAILAATGGSDQHALMLEYQLRPLASFLGIVSVPSTIYVRDNEYVNYKLVSDTIAERINSVVDQALLLTEQYGASEIAA